MDAAAACPGWGGGVAALSFHPRHQMARLATRAGLRPFCMPPSTLRRRGDVIAAVRGARAFPYRVEGDARSSSTSPARHAAHGAGRGVVRGCRPYGGGGVPSCSTGVSVLRPHLPDVRLPSYWRAQGRGNWPAPSPASGAYRRGARFHIANPGADFRFQPAADRQPPRSPLRPPRRAGSAPANARALRYLVAFSPCRAFLPENVHRSGCRQRPGSGRGRHADPSPPMPPARAEELPPRHRTPAPPPASGRRQCRRAGQKRRDSTPRARRSANAASTPDSRVAISPETEDRNEVSLARCRGRGRHRFASNLPHGRCRGGVTRKVGTRVRIARKRIDLPRHVRDPARDRRANPGDIRSRQRRGLWLKRHAPSPGRGRNTSHPHFGAPAPRRRCRRARGAVLRFGHGIRRRPGATPASPISLHGLRRKRSRRELIAPGVSSTGSAFDLGRVVARRWLLAGAALFHRLLACCARFLRRPLD